METLTLLILAHKNVKQVERLIAALRHERVVLIVHFDAKMKEAVPDEGSLRKINPNVRILGERRSNYLDTFSLVETTISMMESLDLGNNYNCLRGGYLGVISGQCYPIKPVSELLNQLWSTPRKAYIDCTALTPGSWHNYKVRYSPLYAAWYRNVAVKMPNVFLKKAALKVAQYFEKIFVPKRFTVAKRLKELGVDVYGGSAWWIMPVEMAESICREYCDNKKLVNAMRGVVTPEEIFFQTMAMRTAYKYQVVVDSISQVEQNCLTYANFLPPGKPFTGHPYILTVSDLEWLMEKRHFFARKFDLNKDPLVFDKLDKIIT